MLILELLYNIISITRDNASSNDTLITAFTKHYAQKAMKFQEIYMKKKKKKIFKKIKKQISLFGKRFEKL
ncbi:hypothetical protein ACEPPN_005866 [Leptodophora sp. 'Broadleaf-Isolate-01']